jgi:hypothetical protein
VILPTGNINPQREPGAKTHSLMIFLVVTKSSDLMVMK